MMSKYETFTIMLLVVVLGVLITAAAAQVDDTPPVPMPTTIEVKDDDYVVTDKTALEMLQRIEGKLDWIMEQIGGDTTPITEPAININIATYDELLTVPGVGPIKAGSIIAERGQGGAFAGWDEMIQRVSGVGPATVADMQAGGAVLE